MMPSPAGHSLIGLAIGLGYYLPARAGWRGTVRALRELRVPLLVAVFLANLPDLDFLPGVFSGDINAFHHGYTHTLGWIVLVSAGLWLLRRAWGGRVGVRWFSLLFLLLGTHLLADWVTADGRAPYGIMALWPFSDEYWICPVSVFDRLQKADWSEVFRLYNFRTAGREVLITAPLAAAVMWWKARTR